MSLQKTIVKLILEQLVEFQEQESIQFMMLKALTSLHSRHVLSNVYQDVPVDWVAANLKYVQIINKSLKLGYPSLSVPVVIEFPDKTRFPVYFTDGSYNRAIPQFMAQLLGLPKTMSFIQNPQKGVGFQWVKA